MHLVIFWWAMEINTKLLIGMMSLNYKIGQGKFIPPRLCAWPHKFDKDHTMVNNKIETLILMKNWAKYLHHHMVNLKIYAII